MEAFRTTINSDQLVGIIDLPMSLYDREVDVIVLPSAAATDAKPACDEKPKVESIMGILKQYANPALRELEKDAWPQAAHEKYLEKMKDGRS
jgi:thiamine pyrophosphate-dependent acetolactate synthase large subunit-like protein